jgi:hypothetical protein
MFVEAVHLIPLLMKQHLLLSLLLSSDHLAIIVDPRVWFRIGTETFSVDESGVIVAALCRVGFDWV